MEEIMEMMWGYISVSRYEREIISAHEDIKERVNELHALVEGNPFMEDEELFNISKEIEILSIKDVKLKEDLRKLYEYQDTLFIDIENYFDIRDTQKE